MPRLILPHTISVVRHAVIPDLWRITCTCGFVAIARGPDKRCCDAARLFHQEEIDPYNPKFTGEERIQ